jgi:hypothetical protein
LAEAVKIGVGRSKSLRKPTILNKVIRVFLPFQANVGTVITLKRDRVDFKFTDRRHPFVYTDLIFEARQILQLILALNKLRFFHVTAIRSVCRPNTAQHITSRVFRPFASPLEGFLLNLSTQFGLNVYA